VINSIYVSSLNITPLIHLRAASMLGFSCSNEKVIVSSVAMSSMLKFLYAIPHLYASSQVCSLKYV
jgi:hypothetical protein